MIGDLVLEYFAGCSLWFSGGGKCFFIFVATIYSSETAKKTKKESSDLHPLNKVDFIRMDYNLDSKFIFKDKTTNK